MLDTFLLCPRKYYYRFGLNKAAPKIAKPLDRGQVLHLGFEAYFKEIQKGSQFSQCIDALRESIFGSRIESELDDDEIAWIQECAITSCKVHQSKDFYYEILAVEEPFAYELFSDDLVKIVMMGKIDLLVNDGDYKNVPIDHKSYERDFPVHRKTNQFCNYAYALQSNYLFVNRVGLQTSIPPEKKHKRVILSYDPIFLEQWRQNVIKWCMIYLECTAEKSFPMNDTSCDKYMRLCEYYSICDTSGEENKIYKLETDFKSIEPWDVAKSLGSKG